MGKLFTAPKRDNDGFSRLFAYVLRRETFTENEFTHQQTHTMDKYIMKSRILITVIISCLSTTVLADPLPSGRVADWGGGTAEIMTYGHDSPIGRILEDGTVTFDLPTPAARGQTVAATFDRCHAGGLVVNNGEAEVSATMLYVERKGVELGLVAATSPELAAWTLSFGESPMVKGAHLRWLYVDGDASVNGECVQEMLTPAGDLEFRSESKLVLVDGWNLIRTEFVDVVEYEDGSRYETHTVHDALQVFPDDAQWYLETL